MVRGENLMKVLSRMISSLVDCVKNLFIIVMTKIVIITIFNDINIFNIIEV